MGPDLISCDTVGVAAVSTSATGEFLDAILARDISGACGHLHAKIDFRAMTPKRFWEADDPGGVEEVLRAWFEHPERVVERVDPVDPDFVEDTRRIGWRVYGHGDDGAFAYEQLAYVREHRGRIIWLRVICSGPRPAGSAAAP